MYYYYYYSTALVDGRFVLTGFTNEKASTHFRLVFRSIFTLLVVCIGHHTTVRQFKTTKQTRASNYELNATTTDN